MKVVGISEGFHDASASLVEVSPYTDELRILGCYQAERQTGVKNDPKLPKNLRFPHADISVFYEDTELKNQRRADWNMSLAKNENEYSYHLRHHESHAASAYYTAPFDDDIVIVVIDAIGELQTSSIWISKNGKLKCVWEELYPKSIGLFYSAITKRIGLKPNEDEYITMGMAAFGEPSINMKWCFDLPDRNFHRGFPLAYFQGSAPEDIAASAQWEVERQISRVMTEATKYGKNLCYAGGVALNCVANSKVLLNKFEKIWIFPNPGDAGCSLGAALGHIGRKVEYKDCFWGNHIVGNPNPRVIVDYLLANKVVGVANGKAEFGPRALGNRSLLGDVRYNIKRTVNNIKRRQKFRPFAPAILEEYFEDYFEGEKNEFMQFTCRARHDYGSVTHVDGSARVQVVTKDNPSILRKILENYYDRTGIPMLLNTSLNVKGKPMVDTGIHADEFYKETGVMVF